MLHSLNLTALINQDQRFKIQTKGFLVRCQAVLVSSNVTRTRVGTRVRTCAVGPTNAQSVQIGRNQVQIGKETTEHLISQSLQAGITTVGQNFMMLQEY